MKNIKVSVAVITYNSSATVLETLNSIKNQTYGSENIELIISDDCSIDLTISVIESWIAKYKHLFYRVEILKSPKNLGVAKNCNSAWLACTSGWIKTIAGDDLLMTDCLDMMLDYVQHNPNVKFLFSHMVKFDGHTLINSNFSHKKFFKMQANEQFRHLIIGNFINAPSSFIHREALSDIGFADEKYKLIEDYPLWLKITANNQKLDYLNKKLVKYRVGESISKSKTKIINEKFYLEESIVRNEYATKYLKIFDWLYWLCLWDHAINKCVFLVLSHEKLNVKRTPGHVLYGIILLCSPLRYIRKIRHLIFSKIGS